MEKQRFYFTVSVPRVPGVAAIRFQVYIQEAVSAWGGQFEPCIDGGEEVGGTGDPLGPPCVLMEEGAVRVTLQRQRKKGVRI